jgi:hypothetical protein
LQSLPEFFRHFTSAVVLAGTDLRVSGVTGRRLVSRFTQLVTETTPLKGRR